MESQRVRQDWVTFTYIQWDQRAVSRIRRVKTIRRSKIQEAKSLDGFPSVSAVKNLPAMQETWVRSLGWEDALKEGTATHSSILAGRIPWTEEPCRLQFTGSHRVGHHWIDLARAHTHKILEGRETQEISHFCSRVIHPFVCGAGQEMRKQIQKVFSLLSSWNTKEGYWQSPCAGRLKKKSIAAANVEMPRQSFQGFMWDVLYFWSKRKPQVKKP